MLLLSETNIVSLTMDSYVVITNVECLSYKEELRYIKNKIPLTSQAWLLCTVWFYAKRFITFVKLLNIQPQRNCSMFLVFWLVGLYDTSFVSLLSLVILFHPLYIVYLYVSQFLLVILDYYSFLLLYQVLFQIYLCLYQRVLNI